MHLHRYEDAAIVFQKILKSRYACGLLYMWRVIVLWSSLKDLPIEVVMILTCCSSLSHCKGSTLFVQSLEGAVLLHL